MKEIPLSQNQVALVDDDDHIYLSKYKWYAIKSKLTNGFYAVRNHYIGRKNGRANCQMVQMHQCIMGRPLGKNQIDHINKNGLDNRKENLRIVSHGINTLNRKAWGQSKYKGVSLYRSKGRKDKWRARIHKDRKCILIGYFDTEEEAAKAYQEAFDLINQGKDYGRKT